MNFFVLHGTSSNSRGNWFPWLKTELKRLGHTVVIPDLPDADQPNIDKYWAAVKDFDFNNSIVIGQSSGAVALLGILEKLDLDQNLHSSVFIGSFTKRLAQSPSWSILNQLFTEPFNYEDIKQKAGKIIFIHGIDDPICDIDQAKELHGQLGGEFIELKTGGHFIKRLDPGMDKFPELLDIIKTKVL